MSERRTFSLGFSNIAADRNECLIEELKAIFAKAEVEGVLHETRALRVIEAIAQTDRKK